MRASAPAVPPGRQEAAKKKRKNKIKTERQKKKQSCGDKKSASISKSVIARGMELKY